MGGINGCPGSFMILSFSWEEDSALMPVINERMRQIMNDTHTPTEDAILVFFFSSFWLSLLYHLLPFSIFEIEKERTG